jgi:hypothetical protein
VLTNSFSRGCGLKKYSAHSVVLLWKNRAQVKQNPPLFDARNQWRI